MNTLLTVINVTAPVFLLAFLGYVWVKSGFEYRIEFVTRLAMTLSVPCLIFVALMETTIDPSALTAITLAAVAAYAGLTVLGWILVRVTRLDLRTYLAPVIMGNTGNVGLPIAFFAFGETGLGYAVVVFAVMAIYSFTFGIWLVSGGGSPTKIIREPIVGATLLGAVFLWQGWSTPQFLTNALDLVGQMAIPLMLITLGVAVARLEPVGLLRAAWISAVRIAMCVAVGVTAARVFALEPVASAVLILQVSTPVAVTSYLIAEKYGTRADEVAGLVVVSTLLSIAALPVTLWFLV